MIVRERYQKSEKGKATTRAREQRSDVKEKRRVSSATRRVPHPKPKLTPEEKAESRRMADNRYALSEKMKAKKRRDYARRKKAIVPSRPVTAEDWIEILENHKHRCFYCHRRMMRLTIDHVIPLSKGGTHTKENLVPACQSCNSRKSNKIVMLL